MRGKNKNSIEKIGGGLEDKNIKKIPHIITNTYQQKRADRFYQKIQKLNDSCQENLEILAYEGYFKITKEGKLYTHPSLIKLSFAFGHLSDAIRKALASSQRKL